MDLLAIASDPQATAMIEAARIGADATTRAAWIQAGAAVGAIAAGALAYIGAVRQVRLQERAQEVRALAYRFRLSRIVEDYHSRIAEAWATAAAQLAAFRRDRTSVEITSFRISRPQTLHDDNWEVHALLGRRAVELILLIDDSGRRVAQFDSEITDGGVRTDGSFHAATPRSVEDDVAATAPHPFEDAIVDYVAVLDTLRKALEDLRNELAKPIAISPWKRLQRMFVWSKRR